MLKRALGFIGISVGILLCSGALRAAAVDATAAPWEELKNLEATFDDRDVDPKLHEATLQARFEALLAPYTDGRARDDFWVALMTTRSNLYGDWTLEVAAHLAAQAPSSPANTSRYTTFVRERVTRENFAAHTELAPWIEQLQLAAGLASSPAERAWFAVAAATMQSHMLRTARYQPADPAEIARLRRAVQLRWQAAQAATRETRWAAVVQAASFLAQLAGGSTNASSADELRAEIAELIRTLREMPSSPENDEAAAMLARLAAPELGPYITLTTATTYAPGTDMAFTYQVRGAHEVRFELFRFSDDEWVESAANRQPIEAWSLPVPAGDPDEWFSAPGRLPAGLEPGFYVLRTTVDPPGVVQRSAGFLVTTADATVTLTSSGASEAFLHDRNSGAPIAGATVRGTWAANGERFVAWEGTTDTNGRIVGLPHESVGKAKFQEIEEWTRVNMSARSYHVAVVTPSGPAQLQWRAEDLRPYTADLDLMLDRIHFRPGEVVRWQAIARDRDGGRLVVPPADSSFHLSVQGPEGVIKEHDYALDAAGTATGEFLLPATWNRGRRSDDSAYVQITAARNRADGEREWYARRYVLIEAPTPSPPVAQIEITGNPARQRPGGMLQASVRVQNADGSAIAGIEVDFAFVCVASRAAHGTTATEFTRWKRQIAMEPTTLRLDAAGAATVRLALPAFLLDASWILIHATVHLQGGEILRLVSAAPVATHNALGFEGNEMATTTPQFGNPTECSWMVVDVAGKPRAMRGEVWLYERRPAVSAPPPGTTAPAGTAFVDTLVTKQRVRAKANGMVNARITPPRAGMFFAKLVMDGHAIIDDCDDPERAFAFIPNADAAANTSPAHTEGQPRAAPSQSSYGLDAPTVAVSGQPLSFGITVPENESLCWLAVVSEDRATVRRVLLTAPTARIDMDDPPSARASLWASLLDSNGVVQSKIEIPIQRAPTTMTIEPVTTNKTAAESDRKTFRIRVRGANDAPLPARVSIRVTDDAESPLELDPWPPELELEKDTAPVDVQILKQTPPAAAVATIPKDSWRGAFAGRADGAWEQLSWAPDDGRDPTTPSPFLVCKTDPNKFYVADRFGAYIPASTLWGFSLFRGQRRPAGDQDEKPPQPRVATTVLWAPNLATDEQGEVLIEFDVPSGINHWRIDALAAGLDGETFIRASRVENQAPK